jgi:hypothetical protein
MKLLFFKTNLTVIQKICLSGLFMALIVILQKVVAVNYLAFAPFVRISFGGPALIIFASVLLGPIYGALIGMGSDLLGYLIFDPRMYPPYLQITAIYTLLGFLAYFIFSLVFSVKNRKAIAGIEIATLSLIWVGVSLFVILSEKITLFSSTYDVPLLSKILIPSILGVMFIGVILFSLLVKSKDENPYMSPLHICFASLLCDILIIVLFGSVMKAWAFGFATFLAIILCQAMVMFVNVMLDTLFISTFMRFTKKYFVR